MDIYGYFIKALGGMVDALASIDGDIFPMIAGFMVGVGIVLASFWWLFLQLSSPLDQGRTSYLSAGVAIAILSVVCTILYYGVGGNELSANSVALYAITLTPMVLCSLYILIRTNRAVAKMESRAE